LLGAITSLAAFHPTLVSQTSGGDDADGESEIEANGGSISGDGNLVAFGSVADNLPHGDGTTERCYVRNVKTEKTRLVSVASNGEPATARTKDCKISENGRFVTFFGEGDGLPGANGRLQVWEHDLKTGKTRLASRAANGDPAEDGDAQYPSVSGNGRFVAFEGSAENLPGSITSQSLAYVRDMKRGKTIVGSKTSEGDAATGNPYGQALSFSGRMVTFESSDPDMPHGGSFDHVYVRNLKTGKVTLIDRATDGTIADASSDNPAISADGRFVTFTTFANNLPGGEGSGTTVFLRDLKLDKTTLVSQTTAEDPAQDNSDYGTSSEDGRYVAFQSNGANLPQGNGTKLLIYVRDMREGETTLVSRAENGDAADAGNNYTSLSLDGQWVVFKSDADNLGDGDTDFTNVFRAGPIG